MFHILGSPKKKSPPDETINYTDKFIQLCLCISKLSMKQRMNRMTQMKVNKLPVLLTHL